MKKLFFWLFLIGFFSLPSTFGFDINTLTPVQSSVIDKVGVLSLNEKSQIESQIQELRRKYTTEILLVIIPSTDGEDIAQLATKIGQTLGVGKADKDNGIVILIAINDTAWNISTGYGMEGVLPDLLTKKIGEKNFPIFKEKKYAQGIQGTLSDIGKAIEGDESILSLQKERSPGDEIPPAYLIVFFLVMLFSSIFLKPLAKSGNISRLFFFGGGGFIITLIFLIGMVGMVGVVGNIIIWIFAPIIGIFGKLGNGVRGGGGGGGGGGGFGGFGGGGFGGGGSSGKW